MRYLKYIFFLIVFIQSVHAQDYLKLYEPFLPALMKNNPFLRKSTENIINKYYKLNPEIAAVHLQYLKLFFDKRISNPDLNLKNYEKNLLARTINRRSEWADSILNTPRIKTLSPENVSFVTSYFKSFIRPRQKPSVKMDMPSQLDTGLVAYMEYLYFSGDKQTSYLSNVDYVKRRDDAIKKRVSHFTRLYNDSNIFNMDEYLEEAKRFAYLFSDSYVNRYKIEKTTFSLLDFILKIRTEVFKNDARSPKMPIHGFSSIGFTVDKINNIKGSLTFSAPFIHNYTKSFNVFQTFSLFYTKEFVLKNDRSFLSSLWLKARVTLLHSSPSADDIILLDGIHAVYGLGVNGAYHIKAFNNVQYSSADLQATTSLLSGGPISLNFGFNLHYYKLSYAYYFYVDGDVKIHGNPEFDISMFPEKYYKQNQNDYIIAPVLEVVLITKLRMNVFLTYISPWEISAGISYNL